MAIPPYCLPTASISMPQLPKSLPITVLYYPASNIEWGSGLVVWSTPSQGIAQRYNTVLYSHSDTVAQFKAMLSSKLNVEVDDLRLWNSYYLYDKMVLLEDSKTMTEAKVVGNDPILVELRDPVSKRFLFDGTKGVSNTFSPEEAADKAPMRFPDVSALLLLASDSPLKSDLQIHHKASGKTFHLHKSILDQALVAHNDEQVSASDLLTQFISSSTLLAPVISNFLEYRYFRRLERDSTQLLLMAWMSKAVFGCDDGNLLAALQVQLSEETDSFAGNLLMSAWLNEIGPLDLDAESLIVTILLDRLRSCRHVLQSSVEACAHKASSKDLMSLISRTTALILLQVKEVRLPKVVLVARSSFTARPVSTDFSNLCSTNFVFQLCDEKSSTIGACGWLLYVRWPWFKSLIDSGLDEAKTRVVTLPADSLTSQALISIISAFQSGIAHEMQSLSRVDALSILRHAGAFGLVNEIHEPLPWLGILISHCDNMLYPATTENNCWEQLRIAHYCHSSKYDSLLHFVCKNTSAIPRDAFSKLSDETILDVTRLTRKLNGA